MTADEISNSLMRNPLLAYQVALNLTESTLVGPWEHASGIENSYAKTYERRHVSGHTVGTVCKTVSGAVWWTNEGDSERARSLSAARAEVDRVLRDEGFVLSTRGTTTEWVWDTIAWVRRAEDGTRLARVWGNQHGKYELFEFAFSDYTLSLVEDTVSQDEAKKMADACLLKQGWTLR